MPSATPRGPAAHPDFPISTRDDNPYDFTPQLMKAARLPAKVTDKYIFFFGYEGDDPIVGLQQWFPAPFSAPRGNQGGESLSGHLLEFATTEHYMMYQKANLMNDIEIAEKILSEPHPSMAKKLGRQVRNFDGELWKANADRVVEDANWYKFTQCPDLAEVLLSTGDKILVEASPDDKIWGIGFNSEDAEGHEAEWGNNGLGKALMKVRDRLREQMKEHKA